MKHITIFIAFLFLVGAALPASATVTGNAPAGTISLGNVHSPLNNPKASGPNLEPPFPSLVPLIDSMVSVPGSAPPAMTWKVYFGYINTSPDTVFIYQDTLGSWAQTYNAISGNVDTPLDTALRNLQYFYPGRHGMSLSGSKYVATFADIPSYFITWTLGMNSVTASASNPLPIQLASFKAATLNSKDVTLTWTTVSETNNYGFYVQRDGVNITFIPGHGTTIDQHTYSYTDNPSPGKYQYRLKQVDLDGTAMLSESVTIDLTAPARFALDQNYPNPFNPSTQISFAITKEGPVSLRVFDILGREAATLVNENRKAGQYTEEFDGNQMASGVYIYVLRSSEGQLLGRMLLLK